MCSALPERVEDDAEDMDAVIWMIFWDGCELFLERGGADNVIYYDPCVTFLLGVLVFIMRDVPIFRGALQAYILRESYLTSGRSENEKKK